MDCFLYVRDPRHERVKPSMVKCSTFTKESKSIFDGSVSESSERRVEISVQIEINQTIGFFFIV